MTVQRFKLEARLESWRLTRPFVIARTTTIDAQALYVRATEDGEVGQGESEPHESDGAVCRDALVQVRVAADQVGVDTPAEMLRECIPLATARNAVDCALWDLRAKLEGVPVWRRLGLAKPRPIITAITLGIDSPAAMGERAREVATCPLLKIKLGRELPVECVEAVRAAAPAATLTADANEAWTLAELREYAPPLARLGVALLEQPLPAIADHELAGFDSALPLCADESCIDTGSLAHVATRYRYVNIKLDKTGGLSEALRLLSAARARGLGVMTGCNVGTSVAMAPAFYLGMQSDFVDIDGASMLIRDREPAMHYDMARGLVHPPEPGTWG